MKKQINCQICGHKTHFTQPSQLHFFTRRGMAKSRGCFAVCEECHAEIQEELSNSGVIKSENIDRLLVSLTEEKIDKTAEILYH